MERQEEPGQIRYRRQTKGNEEKRQDGPVDAPGGDAEVAELPDCEFKVHLGETAESS